MIRTTRAFVDSEGMLHATREAACKAEFRRALIARYASDGLAEECSVLLETMVEDLFDLDKIIAEAQREDTRADIGLREVA